jgi:hypothetical protein
MCRPVSEKKREREGVGAHTGCAVLYWEGGGGALLLAPPGGGSGAEARGGGALLLARIERGVLFLIGNKHQLIVISCLVFSSWA